MIKEKLMKSKQELFEAVQVYFDALYYCDTEKLDAVFHETSSLFDADEGKMFVEPIASFSDDVGSRTSPASKGQKREDEQTGRRKPKLRRAVCSFP